MHFELLKQHSGSYWFHNNGEVEMAVHGQMQMQQSDFYHAGTYKHMPRLDKYINVLGDCVEKQYFRGLNVIYLRL